MIKRLIALRERRGLSQRVLAKKARVGHITIARLELGMADPRLSTLRRLAKALGVHVSKLLKD